MKDYYYILESLPYGQAFKFVKKIIDINDTSIHTEVEFSSKSFFYSSHFLNKPVVPGVIITEAICQSALISHVYYLENIDDFINNSKTCLLSNFEVEFLHSPDFDKVYYVKSEKIFFRNNTFKAKATLFDDQDNIFANFSGILKVTNQ